MMFNIEFQLPTPEATHQLGENLSRCLCPGFKLYLQGDLGAGKSSLTRGFLRGLGVKGALRSPSYSLVEPYDFSEAPLECFHGTVFHFDFYRLENTPLAWREAGFEDAFSPAHAAIVEWPQYAAGLVEPTITIHIKIVDDSRKAYCSVKDQNVFEKLISFGGVDTSVKVRGLYE